MKNPYDIIIKPVLSEKSYDSIADRRYTFLVDVKANKTEIKQAVEAIFGVKVESVNTLRQLGKMKRMGVHTGRRPSFKKAYVKLTADSKEIEFFEGMVQ
ncbi:MAG: 50S ribosomal protein L23 [Caldicoprobacterales bacterium]|jgi:large subunit ribosomal protein L23|nr:50S ribosomal protein L23 [Clostridiales bacterium]